MGEAMYGIGEGPAMRVSLSLPEGTAEAIRARVGKREFSAFIAEAVERELRGRVLDEYLADRESCRGPVSEQARQRARQVFDEVFAEGGRGAKGRFSWAVRGSRSCSLATSRWWRSYQYSADHRFR